MKNNQEWTVVRMINWATEYFREKSVPAPRLSIDWILAEVLRVERLNLYMQYDRPLTPEQLEALRPLIKRRANNEPLQYITGYTDFFNCRINVNPQVLIPRPETEQLTELVLQHNREFRQLRVLDVGTGSGCIAIALKHEQPDWDIVAMEQSSPALETARENAVLNQTTIEFIEADYTDPNSWKNLAPFDVIISNPPYIPDAEFSELEPQVKDYEPRSALYSEKPPDTYRQLAQLGEELLLSGKELFAEINTNYADQILTAFPKATWEAELLEDYGKTPRFIRAKLR